MNRHNDFLSHAAEYARQAQPAYRPVQVELFRPGMDDRLEGSIVGWIESNPREHEWLEAQSRAGNGFATSLLQGLARYGSLTPNQLAAVRRNLEARVAPAAPQVSVAGAGFSKLLQGFQAAQNNGLRRPRLRIGPMKFSLAPENGRNAGYVYVKTTDGTYLGKISPTGQWSRSYECTPAYADAVATIGRDPLGALVEHGHQTGNCGICNRRLSDPESVTRGIGPICAAKYGWN